MSAYKSAYMEKEEHTCRYFSVKLVYSIRWRFRFDGISICSSLSTFWSCGLNDIKSKLKIGYAKIVPNRGRFSRKALSRLYSTYCDHSILFLSSFRPFFNSQDLQNIRVLYFSYCKYLLYLQRSYRNRKIISKFCAIDIIFVYKRTLC